MHYTKPEVYEFISKQTSDPIVERKTCEVSGQKFAIFQSDLDFYDKISPVFNGKKYKIPTPRLCPEERQRRRLMFRNERNLYRRKCDATGEPMITIYSPNNPIHSYAFQTRNGDKWDASKYAQDIDLNTQIIQQIHKLTSNTPRPSIHQESCENSEYTNHSYQCKNCYLDFAVAYSENCHFGFHTVSGHNVLDNFICENCSNCYECISCFDCQNLFYSNSCKNCNFSSGLYNCSSCEHCINCSNLSNKKYYINNKAYSKEEYNRAKANITSKYQNNGITWNKNTGIENSIGDELNNVKNCIFCFSLSNADNCKYIWNDFDGHDSADSYGTHKSPLTFESASVVSGYHNIGCFFVMNSKELLYSQLMRNCQNCFACVGLKNKQYCIFNKQYTKKEYEQLVPQIIEKMMEEGSRGEFFDPSLSPFGYNETVAQEYFPITRDEALARGYKRQDNNYDPKIPDGVETLKGDDIPANINDVSNDILKKIFICEVSGRPFRIIKQELNFYRKHNLPLPRKHPDIRHQERLEQRPPRELHLRKCDKCEIEMLSVYSQDSEKTAYCEHCYQQEIY